MKYTAEDWMKVSDRYAEYGMERVYFWLSGHHPSKKYPHLYNVDSTKGTQLTVDGVRRLIRYCHDRGIKFYIGGGVFAWTASHYLIRAIPRLLLSRRAACVRRSRTLEPATANTFWRCTTPGRRPTASCSRSAMNTASASAPTAASRSMRSARGPTARPKSPGCRS